MDLIQIASVKVPGGGDRVYKDECIYCFDSPINDGGLYVCLSTFLGFCPEHIKLHQTKTGKNTFLHMRKIKKEVPETESGDVPPKKKPTRLAIGVEGGFDVDDQKVEYEEINNLAVLISGGEPVLIPLPNPELPLQVQLSIAAILAADTASYKEQVASWDGEKTVVSKHAENLLQLDNGVKIPPRGWKCSRCDLVNNLWLNLTDGAILCGRRYFDGSGGNNHAVEHFQETKYPLCVKLGTITLDGADVFSYDEDEMVLDPHLDKHLAHFGINIAEMKKTDRTMAELEIDLNMKIREWDVIQEAGKKLTPLYGPGNTGLRNLGNSCYLNSVMQVLFSLPEFKQRYCETITEVFASCPDDATGDFNAQMTKLGYGLLSGKYSQPPPEAKDNSSDKDEQTDKTQEQEGIAPQMFKSLIGRGHPEFSTNRQQDVQEFILHLFTTIDRTERSTRGPRNPIDSFRYKVEERIQCLGSGKVRYTSREETVLALPIALEAVMNKDEVAMYEAKKKEAEDKKERLDPSEIVRPFVHMSACIETFSKPEKVHDFYSTALQAKGVAAKTTRFATFPDYLMVQMKKFTLGDDWVPKKLDVALQVLEELDLSSLRGSGIQPGEQELPEGEPTQEEPQIDENVVRQLAEMGFAMEGCRKAVYHTNNQGTEAAMNWILEHMSDPDFSTPLQMAGSKNKSSRTVEVSEESLGMIMSMGFTREQAIKALKATDNNLERAADWIFSHAHELDSMDDDAGTSETGPQYRDGNGKYRLIAFISHMGTSTMCGHYVCHILKEGRWVIYNDRKVALSEKPPKELAYLYLYQRV